MSQSARRQFIRSMFAVIEAATWIFKQEALEQHAAGGVVFTPSELALLAETSPVLESDGTVRDAQSAIRFGPNVLFAFKCHARAHSCACVVDVGDDRWESTATFGQRQKPFDASETVGVDARIG